MSDPLLYEINTRCWLHRLSDRYSAPITLANIPADELARWRKLGFTHIWLMGVWAAGPLARAKALQYSDLRRAYDQSLPGWRETDVAGSPYAIGDYQVPPALGGEAGLAAFRRQLHAQGMKLVLDFVPNHLGLDHAWVREQPELFVQSTGEAAGTFAQQSGGQIRWLAYGKDPYFPPWTDTVQLDYRRDTTRGAMTELLASIARHCDGVRCDMAMLVLNGVFAKTWKHFPVTTSPPVEEFWTTAIARIRQAHPDFLFLAEAYWGLEPELRRLGFDYTYDKTLYDHLIAHDATDVQRHLLGLAAGQLAAGAHFLENHDEPRVAALLSLAEHRAAALCILGLPGMRFLHDGQLEGARIKIPVQLARVAPEAGQSEIQALYQQLLGTLPGTAVGRGRAVLCQPRAAWSGNPTAANLIIVQWQQQTPEFDLVVVNLAPHRSQCYVPLSVPQLAARSWVMKDLLGSECYQRAGDDLQTQGLYLDLPPHGAQLFHFQQGELVKGARL